MKGKAKQFDILEKSAEIILIRGYNNSCINEIFKARAIPKGSFYFYFQDKEISEFIINSPERARRE